MDRYRLGPCPGPSTQWQFCRPQRLYVSTNVPRRTCSIGGKPRTIRRRRLRSGGEDRLWMSLGPNHKSVRMNQNRIHRSTSEAFLAKEARSSASATKPKASKSNETALLVACPPGAPVGPFTWHCE